MAVTKINVSSFVEFVNAIKTFKENSVKHNLGRAIFRGTYEKAEEGRHLRPSLERKGLTLYEYELIQEMKRLRPFDFNDRELNCQGIIEKMQHYKLPTRMLDFTFSPYVALWFSIKNCTENGGSLKVYCLNAPKSNMIAKTIAEISYNLKTYNLEEREKIGQKFLEDLLCRREDIDEMKTKHVKAFLSSLYSDSHTLQPIFTYPNFYSEREVRQQSIFAIFFNEIEDKEKEIDFVSNDSWDKIDRMNSATKRFILKEKLYNPFPIFSDESSIDITEIIIKKTDSILFECKNELEALGLNETFLYPDNLENASIQAENWIREKNSL